MGGSQFATGCLPLDISSPNDYNGAMMERLAQKIIKLVSDIGHSPHDLDMLGWHMVNLSKRSQRKNIIILADAIMYHDGIQKEQNDGQQTLF